MTRLLLVAAVVVVLAAGVVSGAGAEWDVYPGDSIQDAIDGAGEGDTIYVHAGTYVENVDVYKRITLIGDGADVVAVRAADASDDVFLCDCGLGEYQWVYGDGCNGEGGNLSKQCGLLQHL